MDVDLIGHHLMLSTQLRMNTLEANNVSLPHS